MKDFKLVGRHKRDCWYRDGSLGRGWYLDTWHGTYHETIRGHRYIYLECNCPGCTAKLRVRVDLIEDFVEESIA